jgi:hypothetical protein
VQRVDEMDEHRPHQLAEVCRVMSSAQA